MLVIVEGVDGVGKTSFCDRLHSLIEKEYPGEMIYRGKAGPPDDREILEQYEMDLQCYRPMRDEHFILDRWHVGELIYGPMLRGTSRLDEVRLRHLTMFLWAKGAFVIHLTAPPLEVVRRRRERGELDLIEDHQVKTVIHAYWDTVGEWTNVAHAYWGKSGDTDITVVTNALKQARVMEFNAASLNDFPTYIGPSDPQFLLLGERRNQTTDDRWQAAFVPVPAGNSGHYLLSSIPGHMLPFVGIANAMEEDLASLLQVLDMPNVVTLGREADRAAHGYPHGSVPHPQYWRRFYHNYRGDYRRILVEAAYYEQELLTWRP